MSPAEYKRKWRKIQAGEREILEYNDLEESFNQEGSEDVQYVFDKHFDNHEEHLKQNLSATETVSPDEETVSSDDLNEDRIPENVFANLVSGWVCKINVLVIALMNFPKTVGLCLVYTVSFYKSSVRRGMHLFRS